MTLRCFARVLQVIKWITAQFAENRERTAATSTAERGSALDSTFTTTPTPSSSPEYKRSLPAPSQRVCSQSHVQLVILAVESPKAHGGVCVVQAAQRPKPGHMETHQLFDGTTGQRDLTLQPKPKHCAVPTG